MIIVDQFVILHAMNVMFAKDVKDVIHVTHVMEHVMANAITVTLALVVIHAVVVIVVEVVIHVMGAFQRVMVDSPALDAMIINMNGRQVVVIAHRWKIDYCNSN